MAGEGGGRRGSAEGKEEREWKGRERKGMKKGDKDEYGKVKMWK